MLENKRNRTYISNSDEDSIRESRFKLFRSLFVDIKSFPRRLFRMEKNRVLGNVDEEIPTDVSISHKNIMEQDQTREEKFSGYYFQWVKSERAGDVCKFKEFVYVGDIEYLVFTDDTRVATSLLGDVVLVHEYESQIMTDMFPEQSLGYAPEQQIQQFYQATPPAPQVINPVSAILEKSKKKTEKLTLTLIIKIPTPELYTVMRENFDDVDNIILDSVMNQVQPKLLRESIKRELQNIYNTKKKKEA